MIGSGAAEPAALADDRDLVVRGQLELLADAFDPLVDLVLEPDGGSPDAAHGE